MFRLLLLASAALFAETVNVPAPDVSFKTENGQVVKLSSLKGKPVMIEVFSTTCPACQMMASVVDKTFRGYGPKGLYLIAVINDESQRGDFARFRKEHGATYPLGVIAREDAARLFNQSVMRPFSVPACAFIDRAGIIRERHTGVADLNVVNKALLTIMKPAGRK